MSALAAKPGNAGFSLVELLVGLALLGMICALLAAGLGLGQRVWNSSEARNQASRTMFDVSAALRRLLGSLQPLRTGVDGSRAVEFRGFGERLEGVVHLPSHLGLGGLYRVRLECETGSHRLNLYLSPYRQGETASEEGSNSQGLTTLADGIEELQLRYFGQAKNDSKAEWHETWEDQDGLPKLLSVTITPQEKAKPWPDLVIITRVQPVQWR
jgi:general secretion pathway protein J